MTLPFLKVAVGVLIDSQGKLLLAKRPADKPMGNLWEFPGGKIENAETPLQALKRELKEELDVEISPRHTTFLGHIEYIYPDVVFKGEVFRCTHWYGEIHALDNQTLQWITLNEMDSYSTLPTCTLIHTLLIKKTD